MDFYKYFQAPIDGFWHWEDGGDVIAFVDGPTICYRNYLVEVLQTLASQGIPPLSTLLLAIASTNGFDQNEVQKRLDSLPNVGPHKNHAYEFSGTLSRMPSDYLKARKRLLLFQTIFQNSHNLCRAQFSEILTKKLATKDFDFGELNVRTRNCRSQDYQSFGLLGIRFKSVSDILNAMASLDATDIEPFEIPEKTIKNDTEFVNQLIDNPKTFPIGALIKRIWSGLHIPQNQSISQNQPTGGFADISNKGDFDKLLISEFAFDDLSMVSRLANNESLYIQKEVPPTTNLKQRFILVDVGLKNWGRPKTIALATALSLANHPKDKKKSSVFLIGEDAVQMDHNTVEGVIDANLILSPSLDNSKGITSFFNQTNTAKAEVVFILEQSVLDHPAYAKTINSHRAQIQYLITTNSDGELDLYQNGSKGKRHLQKIVLPYQQLWERKNSNKEGNSQQLDPLKYPILMVPDGPIIGWVDGHIYRMTKEGTLIRRYYRSDQITGEDLWHGNGYHVVRTNFGRSRQMLCLGENQKKQLILLSYSKHNQVVIINNLITAQSVTKSFEALKHSIFANGTFVFKNDRFYSANVDKARWIDVDGNVGEEMLSETLHKALMTLDEKFEDFGHQSGNVLKNVRDVFINKVNQLSFNFNRLIVNNNDEIKLKRGEISAKAISKNKEIYADKISKTMFSFPDGSTVEIDRDGIYILTSSDKTLKPLYVLGTLNVPIGVANEDYFAGNVSQFRKGNRYQLGVRATDRFKAATDVEDFKELALDYGFELNDDEIIPFQELYMPGLVSEATSLDFIEDVAELYLQGFATPVDSIQQKIMAPKEFYNKYVQKFIDIIVLHETSS